MRYLLPFLLLAVAICPAHAGRLHKEEWYQTKWCAEQGGKAEVVMPDRTRCDCLTDTHAVEFDFADKWAEAVGQALLYGMHTGKKCGIVLIVESVKDWKYVRRLGTVVERYALPVDVWVMDKRGDK